MSVAQAVSKIDPPMQSAVAITPMDMLDRAVQSGQSIEVLTKLMDLQERWEKTQARKSFDAAVAAAKAEIPVIGKNATGHNDKRYANFAAYARVVDPILGAHALGYRFRTVQDEKTIRTTCVLFHKDGHSEENTLAGPADASGSKNAIQAIGSTLTYLQRYSLVQALGLAAAEDDDGKAGAVSGDAITDEQVDELRNLLTSTKSNVALFLKTIKLESLTEIRADKFGAVVKLINDTAAKRAAMAAKQGAQS